MLGLDVWNGNSNQVASFRTATGVTFPLLQDAGRVAGRPFSLENLVVVGPDGIVRFFSSSLGQNARNNAIPVIDDLEKQIPASVPAISVQQTAVDFGTIEAGQTGQITITNTGTGPPGDYEY